VRSGRSVLDGFQVPAAAVGTQPVIVTSRTEVAEPFPYAITIPFPARRGIA
jgi:hypothetical protein